MFNKTDTPIPFFSPTPRQAKWQDTCTLNVRLNKRFQQWGRMVRQSEVCKQYDHRGQRRHIHGSMNRNLIRRCIEHLQETQEECEWQRVSIIVINSTWNYIHTNTYQHPTNIYTTNLPYDRRHMTNEICTHILHIIHNAHATWAHTARAHTTYINATHVHVEFICVYKCEPIHVLCIERTLGPTNSYSVWASAGMIGQGAQYGSPSRLLLRTRVSGHDRVWVCDSIPVTRDRKDFNCNENRVLWINI